MVGTTIAHYQITEKIGEGGMGEVYRAHDTKLNRDVALKILPQAFALDSQRMGRFQREAQVLASLNHSHIAQIHGLEETDGTKALVLELVEGETLAEQIARGPIPVDEALKIALQICEGLEAAHEKGIIHRDLKPANIKITPDGEVKILDFGLAKALEGETLVSDLSHSPTITHAATQAGMILGTASYMSPEQARGQPVDKRTDIWAFGCVLYEMLTGKKTFGGDSSEETVSDVLAAVLRGEPDWATLPGNIPLVIQRLLRRCLSKDVGNRLQATGDVRLDLSEVLQGEMGTVSFPDSETPRRQSLLWVLILCSLAALLPVAFWLGTALRQDDRPSGLAHFRFAPTPRIDVGTGCAQAVSPDGRSIVYVGQTGPLYEDLDPPRITQKLFLRELDDLSPREIPGTERAYNPFFSPDGRWVGFFAGDNLMKVALDGSPPAFVAKASAARVRGATWSSKGQIVFAPAGMAGLKMVSEGEVRPESVVVRASDGDVLGLRWPAFLPDGDALLVTNWRGTNADAQICVLSLSTGNLKTLCNGVRPLYVETGHLVFCREDGTLLAAPFDSSRLELAGTPIPLIENVLLYQGGAGQFHVSSQGTLAYRPGMQRSSSLSILDRAGQRMTFAVQKLAHYGSPRFSPDGSQIAFYVNKGSDADISVFDFEQSGSIQLTQEGVNWLPSWTAEGNEIAFSSNRNGPLDLFRIPSDGSGEAELVYGAKEDVWRSSSSVRGPAIFFESVSLEGGQDILSVEPGGEAKEFLNSSNNEFAPAVSPDGRWLAYVSDESGQREVYVRSTGRSGRKWPISLDGGEMPVWSGNGEELYYLESDTLMAAEVNATYGFSVRDRFPLFSHPSLGLGYDVHPQGEQIVVVEASPIYELVVVLGWDEELRRLLD